MIHCSILLAAVWSVFGNSLKNGFVWDDRIYTANNSVYRGFDVIRIFTSLGNGLEYLPIRDISYALDFALGKGSPFVFHLTNLLLYCGIVILVYLYTGILVRRIWNDRQELAAKADLASFATALMFAVHPIHSEVVSFITCRNALLSTLFFFASAILYCNAVQRSQAKVSWRLAYGISLLCFVLSLFSKVTSIVLPLILLLHLFIIPREARKFSALLTIPYLFVSAGVFYLMTSIAARVTIIAPTTTNWTLPVVISKGVKAVQIIPFYVGKLLIPMRYSVSYDTQFAWSIMGKPFLVALGGGIVVMAVGYGLRKKAPYLLFGAVWYILALIPVLNFFATNPIVADRYAFLPSFAFFFVFSCTLSHLLRKVRSRYIVSIVLLLAVGLGAVTFARNMIWFSDETLWLETIKISPARPIGYRNLGNVYLARGDYQSALKYFEPISHVDPCYHYLLGLEAFSKGDMEAAKNYFSQSLARDMRFIASLLYLGLVYESIGNTELASEMFRQVLQSYQPDEGRFKERAQEHLQRINTR